jgi:hypothetical protein
MLGLWGVGAGIDGFESEFGEPAMQAGKGMGVVCYDPMVRDFGGGWEEREPQHRALE